MTSLGVLSPQTVVVENRRRNRKRSMDNETGATRDLSLLNSTMKCVNETHMPQREMRKDAYGVPICKGSKLHKVSFKDCVSPKPVVEMIEYNVDRTQKGLTPIEGCFEKSGCLLH